VWRADKNGVESLRVERGACWQRAMNSLGRLPPFSPILRRLMGELACEAVSFAKLGELIEQDTVLASNVLRVVNSALYGLRATVNSVRHAISVMGLGQLRNIVLGLSVSQLWRQVRVPGGWSMSRFNRHSVAVATLADLAALESGVEYAEGAFTAGLLHDIGKLLIAVALPEEFVEIERLAGSGGSDEIACEESVTGLNHAELSAAALERWNLPPPIAVAALHHHAPPGGLALSNVLCAANRAANDLGYGHRALPAVGFGGAASHLAGIGLEGEATALLAEFDRSFEVFRELF
jgi:putative nucleotidyltransferase with HDIG domain